MLAKFRRTTFRTRNNQGYHQSWQKYFLELMVKEDRDSLPGQSYVKEEVRENSW
jgi:hypothetical protein